MRFQLAAFADEADGALAKQITAMKENGIDYLEIRGVDGKNISNLTNEEAKEIKKRLDDGHLDRLTERLELKMTSHLIWICIVTAWSWQNCWVQSISVCSASISRKEKYRRITAML